MANKVDRYDTKDVEDFVKWLGAINPVNLHKLYVRQNQNGYHCIAILHDTEFEKTKVVEKAKK